MSARCETPPTRAGARVTDSPRTILIAVYLPHPVREGSGRSAVRARCGARGTGGPAAGTLTGSTPATALVRVHYRGLYPGRGPRYPASDPAGTFQGALVWLVCFPVDVDSSGVEIRAVEPSALAGGQHGDGEEAGQGGAASAQVEPAGAILNLAKVMSVIRHGSPFSHFRPPADVNMCLWPRESGIAADPLTWTARSGFTRRRG